MAGTIEAFKRAFQKRFSSADTNFKIRKDKVDEAVATFRKAITHLERAEVDASPYKATLKLLEQELTAAVNLAKKDSKKAFEKLDSVKERARQGAALATSATKKAPLEFTSDGESPNQIFPNDIPGFQKLSSEEQARIAKEVSKKVDRGRDLVSRLSTAEGPGDIEASPENIADIAWFLKNSAQAKLGQAYERGALTIPDPGNRLRDLFDKCMLVYGRDSSHLKEQQKLHHGQARGIDFYEGVGEDGGIQDMGRLLPSGMRTLLYQQVTMAKGEERLYVKMETESARVNPVFKKKEETPDARDWNAEDVGRSILHLGNLIKAKLGLSQGEDKDLKGYREATPKGIETAIERVVAAAKKGSPKVHKTIEKKLKKARIHEFVDVIDQLVASKAELDAGTVQAIHEAYDLIMVRYADDMDSRFGGEVVLDSSDIGRPTKREDVVEILGKRIAELEQCAHTDELEDLERVLRKAEVALREARSPEFRDDKIVTSHAKRLDDKLPPLRRLIQRMREADVL